MTEINSCLLPDELQYHIEFNVWLKDNGDGTFDLGKKGKSVATVESGKWVGPVKTPLTAEIIACNESIEADATILNKSPYKQGWIVRLKPTNLDEEQGELVSGDAAVEGFRGYMAEKEFSSCIHCEGFDS